MPSPSKSFPFAGLRSVLLFAGETGHIDPNFHKHAGCAVDGCVLVWSPKGKVLLSSRMNAAQARESGLKVVEAGPGELGKMLQRLAPSGPVGLDFANTPVHRFNGLAKLLKSRARLTDAGPQLDALRMVKTKDELSKMAKAIKISKEIAASLDLTPSMTELDVARQFHIACLERGADLAFPTIVAAGPNAGKPHHHPTAKRLGTGIVLMDFGARWEGYCADLTRCFFLGPAKAERKKYEECQSIFEAVVDGLPGCRTSGDIGKLADKEVARAGWPRMIHAIGHGLGLEVHEAPGLHPSAKTPLLPHTPLAIEPGWYSSKFGVRYEDDVVWGPKRARVF